MGKRYHCDFCNKTFAGNSTTIKNHKQGVIHKQLRRAHYDSFRDPAVILAEERAKQPCHHQSTSGECSFGARCIYSHMTDKDRHQLQKKVDLARMAAEHKSSPSITRWLEKRNAMISKRPEPSADVKSDDTCDTEVLRMPIYTLPDCLAGRKDLPPSLMPPTPNELLQGNNAQWG